MDKLTSKFDEARAFPAAETLEQIRHNYFIQAKMRGSDEPSIGGLNINTSGRHDIANSTEKNRKEKDSDALFFALLEDMRQRLAELDARMAESYKILQKKYGDDVIGGMVETFLSEEEKAGLETDQQKMEALAKKFLNPDGTIKDEYKDREEAKYVRDWQEAQKLRPTVQKYENHVGLTTDERAEIYNTAKSVGLAGQENMHLQSNNAEVQETVEQAMETDRSGQELVKADTGLTFR